MGWKGEVGVRRGSVCNYLLFSFAVQVAIIISVMLSALLYSLARLSAVFFLGRLRSINAPLWVVVVVLLLPTLLALFMLVSGKAFWGFFSLRDFQIPWLNNCISIPCPFLLLRLAFYHTHNLLLNNQVLPGIFLLFGAGRYVIDSIMGWRSLFLF